MSASYYDGDGYQSGEILSGGEESRWSDPGSDLGDVNINDAGEESLIEHTRYSHNKWHTPSRPTQKNRAPRFTGVVGASTSKKQSSEPRKQSSRSVPPRPSNSNSGAVLGALSNITNSLDRLVDCLDKQESRLAVIKDKLSSAQSLSSSSSPSGSQKKSKVLYQSVYVIQSDSLLLKYPLKIVTIGIEPTIHLAVGYVLSVQGFWLRWHMI